MPGCLFVCLSFSKRKNNSVMETWQIQTAPGSVTVYCSVRGETPLREGTASLVNINLKFDLLADVF